MARIALKIADSALRITLEMMLRAEGHEITDDLSALTIADTPEVAIKAAASSRVLLVASASAIPEAIEAMRCGVYGYIFLPLQPGEAPLMVERALAGPQPSIETAEKDMNEAALSEIERAHILRVLKDCKGNQAKAARLLGIGRNTLWRKMKTYGLRQEMH